MIHRFAQLSTDADLLSPAQRYQDSRTEVQQDNPLYQVHDPEAADVAFAYKIAKEMIRVNGAHVKVHPRTENNDIDNVFDEDPDPTYWAPLAFKAFFAPEPLEFELKSWGVEAQNKVKIVFFRDDLYEHLNDRLVRVGDLIEIPYNSVSQHKPKYYRVDNPQETGNFRYMWLYMTCQATLLSGDINIRPHTDDAGSIHSYVDD